METQLGQQHNEKICPFPVADSQIQKTIEQPYFDGLHNKSWSLPRIFSKFNVKDVPTDCQICGDIRPADSEHYLFHYKLFNPERNTKCSKTQIGGWFERVSPTPARKESYTRGGWNPIPTHSCLIVHSVNSDCILYLYNFLFVALCIFSKSRLAVDIGMHFFNKARVRAGT